ncbi:DUF7373 family lipoprotein [Nocardia sp. CA-084685]|uniref:DUF7373 family lipoprotein n=1 Tax=Nocardia sp. CA-084685 TaxID=3239970 RepID=UPI003D97A159
MRYRGGFVAVLAAIAAASVSCSTTVTGQPGPGLARVDVATLKTGAYAPEPTAYAPDITSIPDLRLIEARRMLNYLIHPFEIDSEISETTNQTLMTNADSMISEKSFPELYRPVATDNNLLAGVYVSGTNGNLRTRKKLIISILRFPTDTAGRAAADQFDQLTNSNPGRHPVAIPGHPDARASSADDKTVTSFIAHGPYVIVANAALPQPDQAMVASNIAKAIDLQTARLDQQRPVPLDDLLDLPTDPDNIMRRALPEAPDFSDPFIGKRDFGYFEPSGELHFERNPIEVRKAFDESGVDLVGRRGAILYRARDLSGAFHLQSVLAKTGKNDEIIASPPGLPDVTCVKLDTRDDTRNYDQYCVVVYGRYAAVVIGSTFTGNLDPVLYQRAAAQYAILAKSE